jgi:hypothetical protein
MIYSTVLYKEGTWLYSYDINALAIAEPKDIERYILSLSAQRPRVWNMAIF